MKRLLLILNLILNVSLANAAGLKELEREMYRLFYTNDSLTFREVVGKLKSECEASGDEQLYYKAWGNMAIFEATHQRRTNALQIAREMEGDARQKKSIFGQYTAIHVMGVVYHQMRDYDNAEKTFKEAIDFLHKNSPNASAAADYIELILISVNGRGDTDMGLAYAVEALDEPNVSIQHRLRVLTMLCQMEGEKANPDRNTFNKYYEERLQVKQGTVADRADKAVELLYNFVNGNYERALALSDSLSTPDQCIYEKGRIYHKMGDNHSAYIQMLKYKTVRDSMNMAERSGLLSEYIVQLNNERLEAKNRELEAQNERLVMAIVFMLGTAFVALLVWIVWKRVKLTRKLRQDNAVLDKAHKQEHEARMIEHEERRKVEKELDVKREFLNTIGKELRSPLNPITGFSDILAAGEMTLSSEERELMSQHIKESSQALTSIIDNMIELSYYESKASLDKEEVFSPNLVCQNAIDYVNAHYDKPQLKLTFHSEFKDDKVTMKSDMQAVGKIIRQLLDNAMKFTDEGGVVLNCLARGNKIRFVVSDTGCGIEPEWRKHIFEPMMKSGGQVRSSGMGLAICSTIAKLLGGKIWLDDEYTKGCRFIFELSRE